MKFRDRFNKLLKVDLDRVQAHGKTRLQDAIDGGDLDRVKSLIRAGADVNNAGNLIFPPLHQAIMRGEPTIGYFLLSEGQADVGRLDFRGDAPLKLAAIQGDWFLAKEILARKGDVDVRDSDGRTPLFFVNSGSMEIIDLLVSSGAVVNACDKEGNTPLHFRADEPRLVTALLEAGANPALVNTDNKSAAQLVLMANPSDGDVVIALTRANADILHLDKDGRNVLHYLVLGENTDAVSYALRHAPQAAQLKDDNGRTPLAMLLATTAEGPVGPTSRVLLNLLLEAGADPNVSFDGRTWMHLAAGDEGNVAVIECLAQHKADLDIADDKGRTPLGLAVEKKLLGVVDVLLDLGANPNIKDERGWTLLDGLARVGDRDSTIVQRLISGGGVYNKMLPQNPAHFSQRPASPDRTERRMRPLIPRIKDDPRPPSA